MPPGAVNTLNANNSTITLTGTGTPFTIGASSATFTEGNSTVNYTGSGATILTMGNGTATTNSYYNLGLLPGGAGPQVLGSETLGTGALDVNGNLTIGNGINTGATASGNPNINLYGNLTIAANAVYTKGTGTTSFKKSGTQTWTDSTTGGAQDLGTVSISGTGATVNLGSAVTASTITVSPSQTLSTNGAHTLNAQTLINNGTFTGTNGIINLSGTGQTFTNTGTLSMTGNTMNLTGAGAQNIDGQGGNFGTIVDSNTSSSGVTFISTYTATELYVNTPGLSGGTTIQFEAGNAFTINTIQMTGTLAAKW